MVDLGNGFDAMPGTTRRTIDKVSTYYVRDSKDDMVKAPFVNSKLGAA